MSGARTAAAVQYLQEFEFEQKCTCCHNIQARLKDDAQRTHQSVSETDLAKARLAERQYS